MADPMPPLDAATRATLDKLADIDVPSPVSWMPQTWGWAVLAAVILLLSGWTVWQIRRHHAANRYRREALIELKRLEGLLRNEPMRGAAIVEMSILVKRVALVAWPRTQVAALSGEAWVDFLRLHGGKAGLSADAAGLLDDTEYRAELPAMSLKDSQSIALAVRGWIEGHRVSA
jgi:hypothetical protein